MSRKLRIEYPGAMYHVMNRGDQREDIFRDDQDRQKFLSTLGEACAKTEWQVHAYCLMRNHFHLVLETPQPNLVLGMKWLLGVYTSGKGIPPKPGYPSSSYQRAASATSSATSGRMRSAFTGAGP